MDSADGAARASQRYRADAENPRDGAAAHALRSSLSHRGGTDARRPVAVSLGDQAQGIVAVWYGRRLESARAAPEDPATARNLGTAQHRRCRTHGNDGTARGGQSR